MTARPAVERAVAGRRAMSVLVVDIDHFKAINDRHGHAAGDEVLRQIAREISRATRDTDRVYRYGGEEFVVVCEGLGHGQALLAAERLRLRVAATEIQGIADRVTASIGVATTPDDGRDMTELFATADGRLYGAKEAGRNRVLGRLIERTEPEPGPAADGSAHRQDGVTHGKTPCRSASKSGHASLPPCGRGMGRGVQRGPLHRG